jgi:hypothetical protein
LFRRQIDVRISCKPELVVTGCYQALGFDTFA